MQENYSSLRLPPWGHYFILFYGWCDVLAIFTDLIYVDVDVRVNVDA